MQLRNSISRYGAIPQAVHWLTALFVVAGWLLGQFGDDLPKGFASQPYRSTDGTVFVAVEGSGETRIGDTVFSWEPHDIFVIPSWNSFDLECSSEAVLFSYSDRIVQEKLDFFREQRTNV